VKKKRKKEGKERGGVQSFRPPGCEPKEKKTEKPDSFITGSSTPSILNSCSTSLPFFTGGGKNTGEGEERRNVLHWHSLISLTKQHTLLLWGKREKEKGGKGERNATAP